MTHSEFNIKFLKIREIKKHQHSENKKEATYESEFPT